MAVSDLEAHLLFAKNFIKHPAMLGSAIPSSRYLIENVLQPVDWTRARRFVEYGPGVGTFTRHILKHMAPDAKLIAIELNPNFTRYLQQSFADPRLEIIEGSAETINEVIGERGWPNADYVVSGIPFSTMPDGVRSAILERTHAALAPEGAFLVYQFSDRVRSDLQRVFGRVHSGFVLRNLLPARYFHCHAEV